MKQTAVEFLQEALSIHLTFDQQMRFEGLFQQAKEMEKQQEQEEYDRNYQPISLSEVDKEEPKQDNCCTPVGQIKRYKDCIGCDRKPKQETLEEVAERILFENTKNVEIRYRGGKDSVIKSMLDIAKWQQEQDKKMYSEIEVLDLLVGILDTNKCFVTFIDIKEWFEQNKNK